MQKTLTNNTALITGVAGFIGSELAKSLLKNNYEVVGVDNFLLGSKENIEEIQKLNGDFSFINYDLSNYENLENIYKQLKKFSDIKCIWHLAANSDISGSVNALKIDLENTFFTTLSSGLISEEFQVREMVFSSSSAALGTVNKKIKENHGPLLPESYYGAMKAASEAYISTLKTYILDKYTIFRFPNVIGHNTTHGIVFDFKKKLSGKPKYLDVLGDGNQKKPYLHIDDLINGMHCLKETDHENRIFNLSPLDDGIKVKDIAEIAIKHMSPDTKARYENHPQGWPGDIVKYEYDLEKMMSTEWSPKFSSREAIVKCFEKA